MLDDDEFHRLLDHFGRSRAGYRKVRRGVKKRLRRHMEALGCRDMTGYLALVERYPDVRTACLAHLTVTISRFMRDRIFWGCLRERYLPALAQRYPRGVKAWSAGCANGEEPYSLALAWHLLAETGSCPPISILATDLRPDCLARAREGFYAAGSLKELAPGLLERFFDSRRGGRQYAVRPVLRALIRWQQHDFMKKPPDTHFHLILLRNNLLTYYSGEPLRQAFARIVESLVPGGWLAVGSHEHLPPDGAAFFRDPDCPWMYRRAGDR